MPADSLEQLVSDQWLAFLGDSVRLRQTLGADAWTAAAQAALLARAEAVATAWRDGSLTQRIAQLQLWQPRITIGREALRIALQHNSIATLLRIPGEQRSHTHLHATINWTTPVALKRCGIETRFIIPSGPPPPVHSASVRAMREALQKAMRWNQILLSDPSASATSIATDEGVTQPFIVQRLQLAWLAPDIIERIIAGDIPTSLTLERLRNWHIAPDWAEQRAYLLS